MPSDTPRIVLDCLGDARGLRDQVTGRDTLFEGADRHDCVEMVARLLCRDLRSGDKYSWTRPVAEAVGQSRILRNRSASRPILVYVIHCGVINVRNCLTADGTGAVVFK